MGFVGICYGAWVGMHLSREVSFAGCVSPHPSIHIESMLGKDPVALAADMYDSEGALIKALEEKFPGENVSKRFPNVPHGFVTRGNIKEHAAASGVEVAKAVEECVTEINEFFAKRGLLHQQSEEDEAEGSAEVSETELQVERAVSPSIQGA